MKELSNFQLFLIRCLLKERRNEGRFHTAELRAEEKALLDSIRNEMASRGLENSLEKLHTQLGEPFHKIEPWVPPSGHWKNKGTKRGKI